MADISLSDLIGKDDTLQTVTFDVSSGGSLGKFTGAFGVSVKEGADCATDKGWYQSPNVCVFTDASIVTAPELPPRPRRNRTHLNPPAGKLLSRPVRSPPRMRSTP